MQEECYSCRYFFIIIQNFRLQIYTNSGWNSLSSLSLSSSVKVRSSLSSLRPSSRSLRLQEKIMYMWLIQCLWMHCLKISAPSQQWSRSDCIILVNDEVIAKRCSLQYIYLMFTCHNFVLMTRLMSQCHWCHDHCRSHCQWLQRCQLFCKMYWQKMNLHSSHQWHQYIYLTCNTR